MTFLRLLLIFIIIYYLSKILLRIFFKPFFEGFNHNKSQNSSNNKNRREGEITIDHIPETKKKVSKQSGEYINYEEIRKQ